MITGKMFRDGVISASNNIANSRSEVDALNIFPVPDGDTGTNMSMTIGAAAKEMAVYALILAILLFFGAGLGVTVLILTDRMGMSLVVAIMGVFLISGVLSEAIPRVFFREDR